MVRREQEEEKGRAGTSRNLRHIGEKAAHAPTGQLVHLPLGVLFPQTHGHYHRSYQLQCGHYGVDKIALAAKALHAEIVEVEIEVVSPSVVPSGNFAELNRTVTCMVLKANDRRTSCPCHDEFRGPRSDYVRQHRFTTLETISNYRNSYPGFSSGRPRGTTPADDRYIVLQARRNRRQTAGEIARHTTPVTGRPISRFTVARRLHGGGLFARRPVRCVPLTPAHRRRRSLWCREHRNWRDNEWGRVFFTDESRFSLSSDSHRILIWRERGSFNHPSNIIEKDRYGGRGVLVSGSIMLGSRTDLHIFDAGSVNGTRYCNEILLPYVRLFRGAMGLQFLFMDDNAPCHRTVAAKQLLESEDINRMDWPARSPDLNPIEHVWEFLGRRLAARTLPPVTIRELRLALQDEGAAMPQQLIDTLILSMGRRCETCLAVRGDHIPY
ncbi:transposable element Tcb2 transposase [Trichonephila clavipes]|nr:transposable element Tcb2 transposase [Trichonephila clavipes]